MKYKALILLGLITTLVSCSKSDKQPSDYSDSSATAHPITSTVAKALAIANAEESMNNEESLSTQKLNTESHLTNQSSVAPITVQSTGILPQHRIIAYYGNPLSQRMGVLGEYSNKQMISMLNNEVNKWTVADPTHPAIPALHLIATVAQDTPGKSGKYRMIMPDTMVESVLQLARQNNAIMFIDIQTGHDDVRNILPKFAWILKESDVNVGIDPEFNLISSGALPGKRIGTYDASDINYVSAYLESIVKQNSLPPKVLVVHRFTKNGVTNIKSIKQRPDVQMVLNMDGWGAQALKINTYKQYIANESFQYTGFKLFYHNDTKNGHKLMTPQSVLELNPQPMYIQYQ